MTVDRNALANDLEQLGLKAIAGSVRKGTLAVDRAMRSVERTRNRASRAEAEAAQRVLNRYWGQGS